MNIKKYVLTVKKFYMDSGPLHASALTFYTIFAIVPIFAAGFGIAKGFGLDEFLNLQLEKSFPGQETAVHAVSQYAQKLLAQSSGGLIAGVALLVLFYSVYSMLNHIEVSMNNIWQVFEPRNVGLRISRYLALILIAPIILVVAGSLKIFIAKQINYYSHVLLWAGNATSLFLVIILLYWLYKYMPNLKVNSKAAFLGAVHAGIAYILCQSLLIESQLVMNNYSAVYGGFAALPIFLVWVQISWIIVLLGAQLCFTLQNGIQDIQQLSLNFLSHNNRHDLLIRVAKLCISKFNTSEHAPSILDLSLELNLPPSLVRQLIYRLLDANVLIKTMPLHGKHHGYQPSGNPAIFTDEYIANAINNCSSR